MDQCEIETPELPKLSDSEPLNYVCEEENSVKLFESSSLVELSKSSWYPACENSERQTYLRGCKWSPDGTCCLTVVNSGGIHLLELPRDLYHGEEIAENRPIDILESVVKLPESGLIYDFCWYPGMNSTVPESCCWLTTRSYAPLQLWDAFDGALRCSYRGYNAVDELEAAISTCFSAKGDQIYAGYKKCLKTFRTDRPGRECVFQPIHSSASCLAVSPCSDSLLAVGSWNTDISLYDINDGQTKSLAKLKYHSGGVTHMLFHPDGIRLLSGARKDSSLLIWDMRFLKKPSHELQRKVDTNQRIYFDLSSCGRYLVSGGTDGIVSVWDLSQEVIDDATLKTSSKLSMYPLHNDCCNGVSLHPCRPILATSSGQHHIFADETIDIEIKNEDIPGEINHPNLDDIKNENFSPILFESKNGDTECLPIKNKSVENSLQFWWTSNTECADGMEI